MQGKLSPAEQAAASANLSKVLKKDDTGEEFVDMFYLDAYEKNGIVYVFGKVEVPSESPNGAKHYVSACCAVSGNLRSMFVLPKKVANEKGDMEYVR